MTVTVTESASTRITELLNEEEPNTKVRVFVQGGGCAGMEYGFTFDLEQNEDDWIIPVGDTGITVLIDSMSMQYVDNAEIDYIEDLTGARFKINNPNAQTSCGCGSSFSPF